VGDRGLRIGLWLSGLVVAAVLIAGIAAMLVPYDADEAPNYDNPSAAPTWSHPMGTDVHGRDVAMRVFKGIEAFFVPGLLAATLATLLGALAGAIAGYVVGPLRSLVLGLLQLIDTLPRLVFIILVCTIVDEPSMRLIALVAAVLFVPANATVIRGKVEALGSEDYILANVAHGFRPVRILLYHIVWLQCRPLLIRQWTFVFAYVIFVETALSYLEGYGVQEPTPSWGNMIALGRDNLVVVRPDAVALGQWWVFTFPAIAIVVTIAAFMAFGNLVARREEVGR